jgi:hypothetical protein
MDAAAAVLQAGMIKPPANRKSAAQVANVEIMSVSGRLQAKAPVSVPSPWHNCPSVYWAQCDAWPKK